MLTNVHEYDDITRLTFHEMLSQILSPLARTAYLAIARIGFLLKGSFYARCLDLKAKK